MRIKTPNDLIYLLMYIYIKMDLLVWMINRLFRIEINGTINYHLPLNPYKIDAEEKHSVADRK